MVRAYVLIQTEIGRSQEVCAHLSGRDGVVSVDAVTGPYDVIALVEVASAQELGDLLVKQVQSQPGIIRTVTCSTLPGPSGG